MKKFRDKSPNIVEAALLTPDNLPELLRATGGKPWRKLPQSPVAGIAKGKHTILFGEYLLKDELGDCYPCAAEDFAYFFEEVVPGEEQLEFDFMRALPRTETA